MTNGEVRLEALTGDPVVDGLVIGVIGFVLGIFLMALLAQDQG